MSLALKNVNGDFIYFDVITNYSRSYANRVTQHPVDGAGVISDNIIKQNTTYKFSGFISGADFNSSKPTLTAEDRAWVGVNNIVAPSDVAGEITVDSDNNPNNLFPDVIGQFFTDTSASLSGINETRVASYTERNLLDTLERLSEGREEISLFEFDNGVVTQEILGLYLVSLTPRESAESGDAIRFDITLEQVQTTDLVLEEIPEDVRQDYEEATAQQVNRGTESVEDVSGDSNIGSAVINSIRGLGGNNGN